MAVESRKFAGTKAVAAPAGGLARPEVLSSPPKPVDFLHALRRRWMWVVTAGPIAAVLAAFLVWQMVEINYTATAWLRVSDEQPRVMFRVDPGASLLESRGVQAAMVTSGMVLKAVLASPEIAALDEIQRAKSPEDWLRKNVQVAFPGEGDLMQVSMTGENPDALATLVNSTVHNYMTEVVEKERADRLARRNKLQQTYERYLEQLNTKKSRYEEMANTYGASGSDTVRIKELHELDSVATLRSRVNSLRGTIGGLDRKLAILNSRLAMATGKEESEAGVADATQERILQAAEMVLDQDPWIMNAQASADALEQAAITESFLAAQGEDAPSVQRYREQKRVLEEQIAARRESLLPEIMETIQMQVAQGVVQAPASPLDDLLKEISNTELERSVLERELEVALESFNAAAQESEKLGRSFTDLENSQAEVARLQELVDQLATRLQEWEIEMDAAARVDVIEEASVPRTSDRESKWRKAAMAAVVAFAAVLAVIVGIDFLSRRVNSAAAVAYGLGVDVIGDLPTISADGQRERRALAGMDDGMERGVYIESIDKVRTSLLHRANVEGIQVVFVTSATAREGKSTLASQLAGSLARSGRRTLLIDADLRRPVQQSIFGIAGGPGLSECLRGEVEVAKAVQETQVRGLSVLTAGQGSVEVLQALAQGGLREMAAELKKDFDFIILDSGPVLADPDALLVAESADGVLLAVRQDVSRMPRVYEAIQRLESVDLPLLGAVVSGVHASKYRTYYRPANRSERASA